MSRVRARGTPNDSSEGELALLHLQRTVVRLYEVFVFERAPRLCHHHSGSARSLQACSTVSRGRVPNEMGSNWPAHAFHHVSAQFATYLAYLTRHVTQVPEHQDHRRTHRQVHPPDHTTRTHAVARHSQPSIEDTTALSVADPCAASAASL